jgi:hypothetical protein
MGRVGEMLTVTYIHAVAGPPTDLVVMAVDFNILELSWILPNERNGIITDHMVLM